MGVKLLNEISYVFNFIIIMQNTDNRNYDTYV